ncbi:MAG: hypothetical protein KIT02_16230 [Devosia sp.]|uniref:hypothetical protein n=1 Tax=Devosia sp. TaxID=1871048 RepID=UPI0024C974A9|nr:hypothetical protein [Devosia sp.]UYN99433.1 MAG: hypothetical protein KIT02_16230 [Devosia sp.]
MALLDFRFPDKTAASPLGANAHVRRAQMMLIAASLASVGVIVVAGTFLSRIL